MQARLFNEENTGYDVLVASDAIGMGLNLNIGRIIFHTTVKRGRKTKTGDGLNAPSLYWVDPSGIKQIAGRAGRRSSQYPVGEVTAWQDTDLAYIRAVMMWDIPQIKAAGLFPAIEQIEVFSEQLSSSSENSQNELEDDSDMDSYVDTGIEVDDSDSDGDNVNSNADISENTIVSIEKDKDKDTRVMIGNSSNIQLSSILDRFIELSRLDGGHYFMCNYSDIVLVSNWLHTIPLTLSERYFIFYILYFIFFTLFLLEYKFVI